ncbi:hypothetical protein BD560DRAFT_493725 [Blakeslea trispora]|nr:hypothetical protein BD560DRAFT_493725 [Blakeslea trispora]
MQSVPIKSRLQSKPKALLTSYTVKVILVLFSRFLLLTSEIFHVVLYFLEKLGIKALVIVSGYNLRCYDALALRYPLVSRWLFETFKHFNSHFAKVFLTFRDD